MEGITFLRHPRRESALPLPLSVFNPFRIRSSLQQPKTSRRLLVSGSSGLIGKRVVSAYRAAGDTVVRLVRGDHAAPDALLWNAGSGTLRPDLVSGFDAVIHLAGEPVIGRWTAAKKRRILDSRVKGTGELAAALAAADRPPPVFLCASGINIYGNRGDTILDETAPHGDGFLAEVAALWERASDPLGSSSRVVHLRIGVVFAPEGGILPLLLPIYRMGLGGTVGGGRGYVSWVTLDDLIRVTRHLIEGSELAGPVNVVSPQPVTGRELTEALSSATGKPAVIPVPAWTMRLVMGQMAEETVLASVRALPARLLADGFRFHDATLAAALMACGVHPR